MILELIPRPNLLTMEDISEEDTALLESTVEELVDEGADIIFGCSAGYSAILAELQQEYPDVIFAQQSNDVYDNIIEFQIRGYEGDFLNGYLCALMNEGSDQLGFCASMDEASVRTAINSFALGCQNMQTRTQRYRFCGQIVGMIWTSNLRMQKL